MGKGEIHALKSVLISLLFQNNIFKIGPEFGRKEFSNRFQIYLQQLFIPGLWRINLKACMVF